MVSLTNETQKMLYFLRIFKFNAVMYYPTTAKEKKKSLEYLCVEY